MEQGLRDALEMEQFLLHYQPQVSLTNGRILAVEALVRWEHPEQGLIAPATFVPVAERIGLISAIGQWVLQQACLQARRWQQAGLGDIRMTVNLSPHHFRDSSVVEQIDSILTHCGWSANLLELEVTEGVVQTTSETDLANFERIKELGVSIAIDDFGIGYSSLASLRKLPIDRLKIDRYFIHGMAEDPQATTMVGTIVGMARALKLSVVAEGIETREEALILAALYCESGQGYYFSRPVPADAIPSLLARTFFTE
jgi:EAL domain-containing protein (putative c-di-GMP-specific phosphodiesterase class I)